MWLCEEGHACANGASSYFCFVYDEIDHVFVPWAPNSQLRIVADSGWNTDYFNTAVPPPPSPHPCPRPLHPPERA